MANTLTIALAQMDLALGNIAQNFSMAQTKIAQAKARGADIIVLPELWSTASDLEHSMLRASSLKGGMFLRLAEIAREHQITIVGSMLEIHEGEIYNTATMHDPRGERMGVYRKLHLVPMMDEDKYLARGYEAQVFENTYGKFALGICYDLRFPELWRHYALQGARIAFAPAEWPQQRIAHWGALVPARAIENQMFMVACNRVGTSKGETFGGHSMIVDPWGEILVEGEDREDLLIAQIDLDKVDEVRARVPVFKDRRPEVYSKWTSA